MSRNLDKECAGQGQLSSAWDWDWGWVMGYGLWVMGYWLWVMGYGLWEIGVEIVWVMGNGNGSRNREYPQSQEMTV